MLWNEASRQRKACVDSGSTSSKRTRRQISQFRNLTKEKNTARVTNLPSPALPGGNPKHFPAFVH